MFLSVLSFVLTISVLVILHELGHYAVARLVGVKVLRFSVGFGKPIFKRASSAGTEYTLGWLPLGGYVKMLDEREGEVAVSDRHRAFNNKALWQRILVVLAGPFTNFLFAVFAFFLTYLIGFEQIKPVIGKVLPNSIAAQAGLKPDTLITKMADKHIENWQDVSLTLIHYLGDKTQLPIKTATGGEYSLNLAQWTIDDLQPHLLKSLGIEPYRPKVEPIVDKVERGSPAEKAGFKKGDRILTFDGKNVVSWQTLAKKIQTLPQETVQFTLEKAGSVHTIALTLGSRFIWRQGREIGFLGISPKWPPYPDEMKQNVQLSVLPALEKAFQDMWSFLALNSVVIGKMFQGKISFSLLGGPLAIYQGADIAFKQGFIVFVRFLALMSVMLGFVNLLPIPSLDGGHLVYFLIEAIRKKPMSAPAQVLIARLGLILLIMLMIHVTVNDILRLVRI